MNCERIAELLTNYLEVGFGREQEEAVEQHVARCADCRDLLEIWKKLSLLPVEEPRPDSRLRFEGMLQAYKAGRTESSAPARTPRRPAWGAFGWLRSPAAAFACGVLLLAVGMYAGSLLKRDTAREREIAAMHSELSTMRQLVVLSMLQQQSAAERLQGVTWSRRADQLDPQVLSALLHTLRYDSSVDVRLAALDALSRHGAQPQVHKGVADALQAQQSPLVQVALIDQLTEWRDPEAARRIQELRQNPNLNPTVRQRAEWALSKLQ